MRDIHFLRTFSCLPFEQLPPSSHNLKGLNYYFLQNLMNQNILVKTKTYKVLNILLPSKSWRASTSKDCIALDERSSDCSCVMLGSLGKNIS